MLGILALSLLTGHGARAQALQDAPPAPIAEKAPAPDNQPSPETKKKRRFTT